MRDRVLQDAIDHIGQARLARMLGIRAQSLRKWKRVPPDRIVDFERVTGIPRSRLRPELYDGAPRLKKSAGPRLKIDAVAA